MEGQPRLTRFGDISDTEPLPGFFVRRIDGEGLSVQKVGLAKGERSDFEHAHAHPQMLVMLSGRMSVESGGGRFEVAAGDVLELPPNTKHGRIWAQEDCLFLDVFGVAG